MQEMEKKDLGKEKDDVNSTRTSAVRKNNQPHAKIGIFGRKWRTFRHQLYVASTLCILLFVHNKRTTLYELMSSIFGIDYVGITPYFVSDHVLSKFSNFYVSFTDRCHSFLSSVDQNRNNNLFYFGIYHMSSLLIYCWNSLKEYFENLLTSSSKAIKMIFFTTYLISYFDGGHLNLHRKWRWFQYLSIWRYLCKGYFRAKLHFMEQIERNEQYMFVAHPHGIATWNHFLTMTNGMKFLSHIHNDNRRDLAANVLFYIPFVRELLLWLGNVDAGQKTASKVLNKGMSLYIYAGGEFEQILTERGKEIIYVLKRKGFVKLAIKYGVPIIPIFCFGENDLYYTLTNNFKSIQLYVSKKYHIALPPGTGRLYITPIPLRIPLNMCFGKIIRVEKESKPSEETVERIHNEYIKGIKEVFDKYKTQFGCGDRELIIK